MFCVTREYAWSDRTTGERRHSHEVVYGITDLSRHKVNAVRLRHLNRGHWSIENGLFYIRDKAFGEDRHVRTRFGLQVLASLILLSVDLYQI